MIADSSGVLEDDFPEHEDYITADELAEWSFEHARERYEASREERGYDMDLEEW